MILIVGGIGSGKRDFVLQDLGFREQDISSDLDEAVPVVADLQELIRAQGALSEAHIDALCEKQVVMCDDVGCGVVPISHDERNWRDEVGRTTVLLAKQADCVVRMICGIAQVIKGDLRPHAVPHMQERCNDKGGLPCG